MIEFSMHGDFRRIVLGTQEELWELPVHKDIIIISKMHPVSRTAAVRQPMGAYGSDIFIIVGSLRSGNNYLHVYIST